MKKWFVMLLAAISIFAFATGVSAKSSFDPIDEPVTPFERIVYYTQNAPDDMLRGQGVNGLEYLIGATDNSIVIAYMDGFTMICIAKVSDEIANIVGSKYAAQIITLFDLQTYPCSSVIAESVANTIFAMAEEDGVWFRNGYVLHWLPDLGNHGGW